MAKIIKMGSQNITPNKIANPFKTSRTSTTNPFKYQNFEGSTLPVEICADVFGNSTKEVTTKNNKMKMIASSVAGSMEKIGRGFEPIVNFVKRVREDISNAWEYAKNTNFSDAIGLNAVKEFLNKPREINVPVLNSIDKVLHKPMNIPSISESISGVSAKVNDFGKEIGNIWSGIIARIPSNNHIKQGLSVAEYEEMWKNEIALSNVEVA